MRPESKFWNFLRDRLPGHVSRFENSAGVGTPDFNLCHEGIEIWVELKAPPTDQVLVTKEQRVWGFNHSRAGGKIYVIALSPRGTIQVWKHPNIIFVKYDDKYQRIDCPPHAEFEKSQIKEMLEFLLFGSL